MTGPTVAVVNPYSSGALLAPRLRAAGYVPLAVTTADRTPAAWARSFRPEAFDAVFTLAPGDADALAVTAAQLSERKVRCVIAGSETGVAVADRLAHLVTPVLANRPELAGARRHKGLMQQAVADAGLPVADFRTCTSESDLADWVAGRPESSFVLKPATSAASDGVTMIKPGEDWKRTWRRLFGERNQLGLFNDEIVAQDYMPGQEYVVDTFSTPDRHCVTDVIHYRKHWNASGSPVYDSVSFLPSELPVVARLVEMARAVLNSVGIRFGHAHLEIMDTPEGLRLVEIGARMVGGGLPLAAASATGVGPIRTLIEFLGGRPPPASYRLVRPTTIMFLRVDRTSRVTDISALSQIRALPSFWWEQVHLTEGQRVEVPENLFDSMTLGTVGLQHEDQAQLDRDCRTFREMEKALFSHE